METEQAVRRRGFGAIVLAAIGITILVLWIGLAALSGPSRAGERAVLTQAGDRASASRALVEFRASERASAEAASVEFRASERAEADRRLVEFRASERASRAEGGE